MGRTEVDRKITQRAVVVEVEFNGTNKATLRSEWVVRHKNRRTMEKWAEKV
jgi:hypothetical protein